MNDADRAMGGAAAVGLAAAGLAGAATGAALSASDTTERVESFTCQVDGRSVAGRFGKVSFVDGDGVEVLASASPGGGLWAYAVTRPSDRTIWMHPHCGRGSASYRNYCIGAIVQVSLVVPAVLVGAFAAYAWVEGVVLPTALFLAMFAAVAAILSAGLTFVATRFVRFARLSDAIFTGLGFDRPREVDLHRRLREANPPTEAKDRTSYHPFARWVYRY